MPDPSHREAEVEAVETVAHKLDVAASSIESEGMARLMREWRDELLATQEGLTAEEARLVLGLIRAAVQTQSVDRERWGVWDSATAKLRRLAGTEE